MDLPNDISPVKAKENPSERFQRGEPVRKLQIQREIGATRGEQSEQS